MANMPRQPTRCVRWSSTAAAMAAPSPVEVPRPSSSRMTREEGVALQRGRGWGQAGRTGEEEIWDGQIQLAEGGQQGAVVAFRNFLKQTQ